MLDQIAVIVSVTTLVMLMPGPDMVLVLHNTLVGGRRVGAHTSLGVLTGNLVHITCGLLGISWLISQSILAFEVLRYAAAAYLVYLGVTSVRSKPLMLDAGEPAGRHSRSHGFIQGFVSNVLNPKGALFYLGVFTVVITPGTPPDAKLVLIASMLAVSTSFWLFFVWALARPGVRRMVERSRVKVNRVVGGMLVLMGVKAAFVDR